MKQTASYSKLEKIVEQLKQRGVRAEICRRVVKVTETVNGSNPSYSNQIVRHHKEYKRRKLLNSSLRPC